MAFRSQNPTTGELLESFEHIADSALDDAMERAWRAFLEYRRTSFAERAAWMRAAADLLEGGRERWAHLMTEEMGKPIVAARAEADKCAWVCRHYADNAERFLADEAVETDAAWSGVRYEPIGPVLAIMPWNFPFWQLFRFASPALMAGNTALLKHASNVPRCALALEEIFRDAGFPDGVFQNLFIDHDRVPRILGDPRVRAATLTGSVGAGAAVGGEAGRNVKKTVLELGGSDPFVVMPSAELDRAVELGVKARMLNNGQSCIAAKRFIVHEAIADEFQGRFVERVEALNVGDPRDETTDVGPIAEERLLENLDRQVRESIDMGAYAVTGGKRLDGPGYFYSPTVLTDIPPESPAYREELFGPVASLFRVRDVAEAIELANDTEYGLGSAAWTNDAEERDRLIRGLDAGNVFINGMVASDPRLPFGGVKHSGYGRELGEHGIREFVNAKTVWVGEADGGSPVGDGKTE